MGGILLLHVSSRSVMEELSCSFGLELINLCSNFEIILSMSPNIKSVLQSSHKMQKVAFFDASAKLKSKSHLFVIL